MKKVSIVTTTINVPVLLRDYVFNIKKHKHEDVNFVVVADKKTPLAAEDFCRNLATESGFDIKYFSVAEQEKYLKDFPELAAEIPYNCIQRRNIGILYAYQKGADSIITIDDDNFVLKNDFLGHNLVVGENAELEVVKSPNDWFNVCRFLEEENQMPFFHRGFPISARWIKEKFTISKPKKGKVVVNAGFWLGDPDVDAVTRFNFQINAVKFGRGADIRLASSYPSVADARNAVIKFTRAANFMLASGTWSPFNSQNTALAREIIPAYFLSAKAQRYDDIWASYVIRAISDHLGHYVAYGYPLVYQKRNPHNYFKDYEHEKYGMMLTDIFCGWLRDIKLTGKDYGICYGQLIRGLSKKLAVAKNLPEDQIQFLNNYINGMKVWQTTIKKLEIIN